VRQVHGQVILAEFREKLDALHVSALGDAAEGDHQHRAESQRAEPHDEDDGRQEHRMDRQCAQLSREEPPIHGGRSRPAAPETR
jgi:GAF domain-containing protein